MDIDPKTKDPRPWVHGTKVHTAVRDEMNAWVARQNFKTIDADTLCAGSISGNPLRRYNEFSNDSYSGFYLSKGMVFQRE